MRLRHVDGTPVSLAYCTNVHPAEDLDGVVGQLAEFGQPVRERLGEERLGLGLWLARDVARTLRSQPSEVARLRGELAVRGLEVVTLNGFPYRGFQQPVVKHAVYRPDWTEPERLDFTLDLAWILAALLPDDVPRGSISTLPLAWREPWTPVRRDRALRALDELAAGLREIARSTGRTVRVGLEPEPGCIVETAAGAVDVLGGVDREWIGVALDACHLAVAFEDPAGAIATLRAAALPIVKLQAAAALEVPQPWEPVARAALAAFAEPRFLHQTRELAGEHVLPVDDLPAALDDGALPARGPWRTHFHMPLHAAAPAPLATTTGVLEQTFGALFGGPAALTDHVEVETYTWSVLPGATGPGFDLVGGLAAELAWARERLVATGLAVPAEAVA